MPPKIITRYYCGVCEQEFSSFEFADRCEREAVESALVVGDIIISSGLPGRNGFEDRYGGFSPAVVVDVDLYRGAVWNENGEHVLHPHSSRYVLDGGRDNSDAHIFPARTGVVNIEGLHGPIHTDRVGFSIRGCEDDMLDVIAILSEIDPRLSKMEEGAFQSFEQEKSGLSFHLRDSETGELSIEIVSPTQDKMTLLRWLLEPRDPVEVYHRLFNTSKLYGEVWRSQDEDWNEMFSKRNSHSKHDPFRNILRSIVSIGELSISNMWSFFLLPLSERLDIISQRQSAFLAGEGMMTSSEIMNMFVIREDGKRSAGIRKICDALDFKGMKRDDILQAVILSRDCRRKVMFPMESPPVGGLPVYVVASGKGGVGKSTISAWLCRELAKKGRRPLLLDADFYGPSSPSEFGIHDQIPVKDGKIVPHLVDGVRIVSLGNIIPEGKSVEWRGPVVEGFLKMLLDILDVGDADCIIVDLPPGTGDVHMAVSNILSPSGTFIVSIASKLSMDDVERCISSIRNGGGVILGVIENMSHIGDERRRLFGDEAPFLEFCERMGLERLAQVPFVDDPSEVGEAISHLTELVLH
jgi:Mrp family chromosome partitioning ATPase